jgi:hypothetical protein
MTAVRSPSSIPASLEVFLDARGDDRALRVTWHADSAVVVLSQWRAGVCAGTFRLPVADAPALIAMLRGCLEDAYDDARSALYAPDAGDAPPSYDETDATFDETDAFNRPGTFLGGFHTFEDEAG